MRWFVAPPAAEGPRAQAVIAAIVRLLVGVLWTYDVAWKVPPQFGALAAFTSDAVSHPVLPVWGRFVAHVVLPNIAAFGYGVVVVELSLAVSLLTGTYVRLAALVGVLQSLVIGLCVARTPGEWPWSYLLMVAVHLLLLIGPAGRVLAVDAVRGGLTDGRTLAAFWAVIALVVGLISAWRSRRAPLAPRGAQFEDPGLMVGLGSYNVVGGLLLALMGIVLVLAALGPRRIAWVAVALGGLAAASLAHQVGFGQPFLGGTANSAGVFLSTSLVGLTLLRSRP